MEAIGGYFELELCKGEHYHRNAIRLNTAKNCFEYVLKSREYEKVYIPYYTCDVMLLPLNKLEVDYEFYHINEELEPTEIPKLNANEAFLYTNYFGLKQECVKRLAKEYGKQLIVDNAQAFYADPLEGIDTFYSARKFFGVPDGAYLYTDKLLQQEFEQDCSYERMSHLLKRIELGAEAGYQDFRKNDDLSNQGIKKMSRLTEAILSGIEYEFARARRRENYLMLEQVLASTNMLHLNMDENTVPMVYPYWVDNGLALKKKLIDKKVFVATYWPSVQEQCQKEFLECVLANQVVFIPVDQRYGLSETNKIIEIIDALNFL